MRCSPFGRFGLRRLLAHQREEGTSDVVEYGKADNMRDISYLDSGGIDQCDASKIITSDLSPSNEDIMKFLTSSRPDPASLGERAQLIGCAMLAVVLFEGFH